MYYRRQKNILKRNKSVAQKENLKDSDELIASEEDICELTDDNGDGDDDEDQNNEIRNNNFLVFLTESGSKSTQMENDGTSDSDKETELTANISPQTKENTEKREISIASLCSAKAVKDSSVKG